MKKILIFLFLFLFSLNFISSQPPLTVVSEFPEGYLIIESDYHILKQNQPYVYNFFVQNKSNGALISNTTVTCTFFMAQNNGTVIFSDTAKYYSSGYFDVVINGSNFNQTGYYSYGLKCLNEGFGGSLAGTFEVTPSGIEPSTPQGIVALVIMFSIIFFMFFFGLMGFKFMDYENLYGVSLFFVLFSIILAIFGMYLGLTYSNEYLFSTSSEPYSKLFIGTLIAMSALMLLGLLGIILKTVAELKERKSFINYGAGYNPRTKKYD